MLTTDEIRKESSCKSEAAKKQYTRRKQHGTINKNNILQINLNHSSSAQDACINLMNNNNIKIECIWEPYKIGENYK